MAPFRRKTYTHLPPNVHFKCGRFRFIKKFKKPDGKWTHEWIYLGKTQREALVKWSELVNIDPNLKTMMHTFDRYMADVAPLKSKSSFQSNMSSMKYLKTAFGHLAPHEVTSAHVRQYMDERGREAKVSANREKALLSHVFTCLIDWGIVETNPCRNVRNHKEFARTMDVTDQDIEGINKVAPELLQLLIEFKYLTGQRVGDVLKINKITDLTEEGIVIRQGKTKAFLLIEWNTDLKKCVDRVLKMNRSNIDGFTLFCNQYGKPLTVDGVTTLFHRARKEALEKGFITKKFQLRDIRAKSAGDANNIEHARSLLGHTTTRTTEKHYIRKAKKVKPLKHRVLYKR